MNILVACEKSGEVRRAFRALGHDAYSCDLEPADDDGVGHLRCNALDAMLDGPWDLMIAHPPCTYLSVSGLHWNKRRPEREALTVKAIAFARALWNYGIPRIALENPIGCLSTRGGFGKATQVIQPHQFGADASKATCLWLKGLPKLTPTRHVAPRIVNGRPRWANQTDSGQNRLGPSPERAALRAQTYPGIAAAMAEQWGSL